MRFASIPCLTLAIYAVVCSIAHAQGADAHAGRFSATRAELDSLVAKASELANSPSVSAQVRAEKQVEEAALQRRLREGDFEVGDRVVLVVPGDSALSDTFTVQPGRTLNLPNLPQLSLVGVLRSELEAHLADSVSRFVKDTTLKATPLVRLGVLGEVARPGYYHLPTDIPISDAMMAAGGPTSRADVSRTTVRRGSRELLSKAAVRSAMVEGLTLDQIGLNAGDEFVVRAKREWGWQTVAQIAALASGILLSLRAF
jgi:protein involved in polysaccharide export with SLBB domain